MLSSILRKLPIHAVDEVHVEKVEDSLCFTRFMDWYFRLGRRPMVMVLVKKGFRDERLGKLRIGLMRYFCPIGLHVHLAIEAEIDSVPYRKQFDVLKYGVDFLRDCGVDVKDLACGWFSFNEDTLYACKRLGLRLHIWHGQEWKVTVPVETVRVRRVVHDWELIGERR